MRFIARLAVVVVVVYASACLCLYLFQRSLLYFPQPRSVGSPAQTFHLPVSGAQLIVSTKAHAGRKALVYFGGNAEDVSASLASFSEAFPDYAIYLMHYRGYGGSSGAPSEAALNADALALFDRIQSEHAEIAAIGRSLGSGIALRLASQRPVKHLVLITPYDSILAIAEQQFPYFPVHWLLRDRYESWRYASRISVPTLVLQAAHDEVIPARNTDRLVKAFHDKVVRRIVLPHVGHNDIARSPDYLALIREAL